MPSPYRTADLGVIIDSSYKNTACSYKLGVNRINPDRKPRTVRHTEARDNEATVGSSQRDKIRPSFEASRL